MIRCPTSSCLPVLATMATFVFAGAGAPGLLAQSPGFAMRLGPETSIQFPHNPIMLTGNAATMEYWVRGVGSPGGVYWVRYVGYQEHKQLDVHSNGSVNYLYAGSPWHQPGRYGGVTLPGAGTVAADGSWHHVAFVRRASGAWSFYVDGNRIVDEGPGTGLGGGCWLTCGVIETSATTQIGNASTTASSWDLDELRVSNVERYTTNFTPTRFFTTDANTAMHVTFDEGQGSQVHDSSVAQQLGSFAGPNPTWQWIPDLQAAFQPLGTGCAGSAGVPSLTNLAGSLPRPGSTLQIAIGNLPNVATVCVPFLGFNNQSVGGMPLPMNLTAYGMPGCTLYTDVFFSAFVVGTAGTANWSVPIPSLSSMIGTHFYLQALAFDAQAQNPARRTVTNAADATIGG